MRFWASRTCAIHALGYGSVWQVGFVAAPIQVGPEGCSWRIMDPAFCMLGNSRACANSDSIRCIQAMRSEDGLNGSAVQEV